MNGIRSLNAGAYANLPQQDIRLSGDHRPTYTQRRRTQMAGGGITNIRQIGKPGGIVEPGIMKYGMWDWVPGPVKDFVKDKAIPFVTDKVVALVLVKSFFLLTNVFAIML